MSTLEEQVAQEQEQFDRNGDEPVDNRSHEELAEAHDEGEDLGPTPPMQIPIPGTGVSISMTVGGARATTSEVSLRGGKMPVEGDFRKGERVNLHVECIVSDIHFPDSHDEFGNVVATSRRHILRPFAIRRIDA